MEQSHITAALVVELSKVKLEHVRRRVVGQLRNVDEGLTAIVANELAPDLPSPIAATRTPVDMAGSDALSILKKPPVVRGRTLGLLVTDGADEAAIQAVTEAAQNAGATVKIVAPKVGGVTITAGEALPADEMIDGAPSVLFDAVAFVVSEAGATQCLAKKQRLISSLMPSRIARPLATPPKRRCCSTRSACQQTTGSLRCQTVHRR